MLPRKSDVVKLAGTSEDFVIPVTIEKVKELYSDRTPHSVIDVLESQLYQGSQYFWLVGETVYFDDALFGEVVAIDDLDYNSELGLFSRKLFPGT